MSEATTLEAPTTEEAISSSDADAVVAADAADLDGDAGKEGGASTPEAAAKAVTEDSPYEAALREAREAEQAAGREEGLRAANEQREADDRQYAADQQARQETLRFQATYRARVGEAGQDAYDLAIEAGRSEADATAARERAVQRFNTQHADGLQLYESEAKGTAARELSQNLNIAIASALGRDRWTDFFGTEEEPKRYASLNDSVAALKATLTAGLITETAAVAREKAAALKAIADLEQAGRIIGASSGAVVNGGSSDSRSDRDKLIDPNTPIEEIATIRARQLAGQ